MSQYLMEQYLKLQKKSHVNLTWDFFVFCLGQASLNIVICCFWYFWYPLIFFLEFSKNLEFCSDFLGTPDFSRFFFKKSGIFSDFLVPPDFFNFLFSNKIEVFTFFFGYPRFFFWFFYLGNASRPYKSTGSRRLSPLG